MVSIEDHWLSKYILNYYVPTAYIIKFVIVSYLPLY